ncbi:hypothetical protein QFC21_002011 [Naganishia friedmannii]|uniref:Uncharacterized protein n=1 Tax=Naganishia friedmannii TaxID=89922 RepID=A0ACC2VYE8_9TREE|nr:hypothetical protein QFC21_002011 [Naganishia friedmannii]
MTDSWKSPKYAPNSDIEADNKEDSESSDFEASPKAEVKGAADPWNDPEDDDDDDDDEDDDTFLRDNASPDYLNTTKTNENGPSKGNGAWDALHSDDDDEDDDDIPAGLTVGGRESKNSSRNQSTGPYGTPNGGTADMGRSDPEEAEEPQRKRQRTSHEEAPAPEQREQPNGTANQKSESESNRAAPIPSKPAYPVPGPQPPQRSSIPPNQSMGRSSQSRHAPAPYHPTPGLLMSSFFGITPRDEFVRIIGEWLLRVCHGLQGVERQHATLNQCLNKEVEYCSGRAGPHPILQPHSYYPITYKHTYTTDTFFPASQAAVVGGFNQAKRRVTTDDKTGQVVEVMEKCKIANLNIFSPNEEFDWRVSVNIEIPTEVQPNETSRYMRRKDRVSYKHNLFQIDLTQVNKPLSANAPPPVHELEIEVLDASDLLTQGWNDGQGLPNQFEPQLISLLNTVRLLNRNAGPKFSQPPKRQP